MVTEREKKVSTLSELNDKIAEDLQDAEVEGDSGSLSKDECMFDLESKIHHIQKLVNFKRSVLKTMRSSVASNAFSNSTSPGINTKQLSVQMSGPRQTQMSGPRQTQMSGPRQTQMSGPRQTQMSGPRQTQMSGPRQTQMSGPRQVV